LGNIRQHCFDDEIVIASRLAPTGSMQFSSDGQRGKESQQLRSQSLCNQPFPNSQNPPHTGLLPPTSPMLRRSYFPANWPTKAANVEVFLTLEKITGTSSRHLGPLQRVISRTYVRRVQKRDIFC
jgi:hypothetical protein